MEWRKLSSVSQKVGYKYVTTKTFTRPDGRETEYTTWGLEGQQNVAVIAVTKNKKVVVARQFRQGPEAMFDELPGGFVDKHEDPKAAALRELREETGYVPGSLTQLGAVYRDSYRNDPTTYFIATGFEKQHEQQLDDGEFVTVHEISISQLIENAKGGLMSDGVGVLLAYDELMNLKGNDDD